MVQKSSKKFYITTAIDYASGKPHLGHAYEKISADVLAKWNRNIGRDVFFLTGTDEHGQKVVEKASEANKTPQEFVDFIAPQFEELCEKLNIEYSFFIRTTNPEHKKIISDIYQRMYDNGDIYKGTYKGLYCIGCERYYAKDELIDGKICPDHKREVEEVEEENYFFRLSKYQDKLLEFYEKGNFLSPKSKALETINRVKEGLQDISVSRNKNKLNWGIELPFDKEHVSYVWLDALFNYYTGPLINNQEKFFPADVHLIGKDIQWFHNVYWPAFLMSVGFELPKKVFAHGMILDKDGHKMSKSIGNVVDPIEFSARYGVDEFRFFLMALGTFGEDLNFSEEVFAERVNNDLNNDLGNLVSRVHAMTSRYFDGVVPAVSDLIEIDYELLENLNIFDEFNALMQDLSYNKAIEVLWRAIREANAYVNKVAPWKEQDKKRLGTTMNLLCSTVVLIAKYVDCFMPSKAERIFAQFSTEKDSLFKLEFLEEGHKLGEKDNLFSKIVLAKKEDNKEGTLKKEGFENLNLKVGKIISVENHPDAEKLFVEKIDVGEEEPRQIVSGLKDYYKAEELVGKKVIVVANLKPAKLRGILSQGMILAADNEKNVGIITTDAKVGTNLVCDKMIANNDNRIKPDVFFKIEMRSSQGKVLLNEKVVLAGEDMLFSDKDVEGPIR